MQRLPASRLYSALHNITCITRVLLWVGAERAGAGEVPMFLQILIPCLGVIHNVHVADEGVLGQVPHGDILDGLDSNLAAREPDVAVWLTRVVQH